MRHWSGIFFGLVAASLFSAGSAAAQGLEMLHEQRNEAGRVCFSDHFHSGTSGGHATRQIAEREAVANWSGFTALEYGNNWGSWRIAGSRSMNCSQATGSWGCQAEARPCRPMVAGAARRPRPKAR